MTSQQPRPGTPFLLTFARVRGAWWRLVVSTLLGVVGLFAATILAVLAVIIGARALGFSHFGFDPVDGINAGEMLATNLGLAALIPLACALGWLLYGVRPRWLSSNRPGLRWSWLLACVGRASVVWAIFLVLGTVSAYALRSSPVDSTAVVFLAVVLVTTPLQAAGEEYLFRGLLLRSLGATGLPVWACCGVSGAIFAAAHLQFDLPLFTDRFLLGVVLAWLAIRTGGLEAGIAIHAVKNLSVLIPASLLDDIDGALDPQGVTWLPLVIDVILLAIVVPWIVASEKRRRHDRQLDPPSASTRSPAWIPVGQLPKGMSPGWQPDPAVGPGWRPPPAGWAPPPPSAGWAPPPPPSSPPGII